MTARPRLRGLLHQYAFFASLLGLPVLLFVSPTGRAAFAGTVYGLSLVALFGVSALFHRVTWSERSRRWMGRLDHAMINVAIAGSFTPFGLLALSGPVATACMALVWGGALGGVLLHALWIDAPKWLSALVYLAIGWSGVAMLPQLVSHLGWGPTALLALGGALYSAGAAVYALRRPNLAPGVFGALVIVAAVTHYAVVAVYVLPRV
jgi:hemolysin III